ncbi:Phage tail completion protein R [Chromobacterium vaccinii]|nr:Phage tail completion protein R [Chromobacterium vaccinii]QND91734.1 Phage tail completion protein R [Chromobacterium vaccinii]
MRAALEAALPELRDNPDRLQMFVEDGGTAGAPGKLSFRYRYTLKALITDYAGHLDQVMIPLHAWIEENEPPLIQNAELREKGFRFEVDWVTVNAVDLQITLRLSESVRVERLPDGNIRATHQGEPVAEWEGAGVTDWTITVEEVRE